MTDTTTAIGPMEKWVRRWGRPNESGDRIYFTGEIDTFDEQTGTPDTIVPIFDFARQQDALVRELVELIERGSNIIGPSRFRDEQRWRVDAESALARVREGRDG